MTRWPRKTRRLRRRKADARPGAANPRRRKARNEGLSHAATEAHAPFVPHLTHFWHMLFPRSYEDWLDQDNQYIPVCEALVRLPGESSGADKEVALALSLGVPVYYTVQQFLAKVGDGKAS